MSFSGMTHKTMLIISHYYLACVYAIKWSLMDINQWSNMGLYLVQI